MADDKEITIRISAKNLTAPEFAAARKGIAGVGDEADRARPRTDSLGASFGRLTASFTAASIIDRGITSLMGFGQEAFESAGRLVDLANKTGLSTEMLQRMQHVADQTGGSLDTFTQAAFKLGTNVAEGTNKARDAVGALGLNYQQLQALKPEDQFLRVMKALDAMDNVQERNRLGTILFGKGFAEMASAVGEGWDKLAAGATVASDRQLQALDRAGDAWTKFTRDVQTEVTGLLGTIVQLATAQETGKVFQLTAEQQNLLTWYRDMGKDTNALMQEFVRQHHAQKDIKLSTEGATVATIDHVKQLREARAAVQALTPAQREQIDAALKLTGATEALGDQFGLSKEALKLYEAGTREAAKAVREHEQKAEAAKEKQDKFLESIRNTTLGFPAYVTGVKDAGTELQNLGAGLEGNGTLLLTSKEAMAAAQKAAEEWARANGAVLMPSLHDTRGEIEEARLAAEAWKQSLREATQAAREHGLGELADALDRVQGELGEQFVALGLLIDNFQQAKDSSFGLLGGFDELTRAGGDTATGFLKLGAGAIHAAVQLQQAARSSDSATVSILKSAAAGFQLAGVYGAIGGAIYGWIASEKKGAEQARLLRAELTRQQTALGEYAEAYRALGLDIDRLQRPADNFLRFLIDVRNGTRDPIANPFRNVPLTLEQINRAQQEFEKRLRDTNDAYRPLLQSALELGTQLPASLLASIRHLVDMKVLTGDNAAALEALTNAPQVDWEKMRDLAAKYGIEVGALGQKFRDAKMHASAEELINDFLLLVRGGADVGGALQGMREELSQFVIDSIASGTSVPENMRKWIEELQRSGQLYDANRLAAMAWADETLKSSTTIPAGLQAVIRAFKETGDLTEDADSLMAKYGQSGDENIKKIIAKLLEQDGKIGDSNGVLTDLSKVNFGDPIVAGFDRVVSKLEELIAKITSGVAPALGTGIPTGATAAELAIQALARNGVAALGELEDAVNAVVQEHSPTGLQGMARYAGYAGDAIDRLALRGSTAMRWLGEDVSGIAKKFGDDWLRQIDEVQKRMEEMRFTIGDDGNMAGIGIGVSDPLSGGIGRGGSGDAYPDYGSGIPPMAFAAASSSVPLRSSGSNGSLREASRSATVSASPVTVQVYLGLDPRSGRVSMLNENDRRQIQQWLFEGGFQVPNGSITRSGF